MVNTFFLGANSRRGFSSLYGGFPPGEGAFLHVIKGGPGTGKSGFMRRIGKRAEEKGLDVQYVLCSGDPDSLDGVYIPALGEAWVDGTAPHAADPVTFGVSGDYVNLGRFCRCPLSVGDGEKVIALHRAYKAEYARAYSCLSAAGDIRDAALPSFSPGARARIGDEINALLDGAEKERADLCYVNHVFLSAISCKGVIRLTGEMKKLCKHITGFSGCPGGESTALTIAREEAEKRGLKTLLCLSPLDPGQAEAVILPELSMGFVGAAFGMDAGRSIRLDAYARMPEGDGGDALYEELLSVAVGHLNKAKELHDRLEAVYRPYMDFSALTEYTEEVIGRL